MESSLRKRYQNLKQHLASLGPLAVAFSGGVDSTLLLKVAKEVLQQDVVALTAISATLPNHEKEAAVNFARALGVRHLVVPTDELQEARFVENSPQRCYFCKKLRFSQLVETAKQHGFKTVVDGRNRDDDEDFRPGSEAARELDIQSPLAQMGFPKMEIRELSRALGIEAWQRPSDACLASRIPYHQTIDQRKLSQIERAESFLRNLSVEGDIRVRHEGRTARIEVTPDHIEHLSQKKLRDQIVNYFLEIGFHYVALDLGGYQMGKMNQSIFS